LLVFCEWLKIMNNKEIIVLGILGCLAIWGTYSLGVWLVSGFK